MALLSHFCLFRIVVFFNPVSEEIHIGFIPYSMFCGSLVTKARRVLGVRIDKAASSYGG
jgi:hypothetical protein